MLNNHPIVLADFSNIVEMLITIVVFAVIVIGSIAQSIKESSSKRKQAEQDPADEATLAERKASQDRLNEMAEKRRRQLQELARRRREAQGQAEPTPAYRTAPPPPPSGQMREAERERRSVDASRQRKRDADAASSRHMQVEQARQAQATAVELERQRRLNEKAEALAERQSQHRQQFADRRDDLASLPSDLGKKSTPHGQAYDARPTTRHGTANLHAAWLMGLPNMKRTTLQRAILLQEVFNKPLALRDPLASPIERQ